MSIPHSAEPVAKSNQYAKRRLRSSGTGIGKQRIPVGRWLSDSESNLGSEVPIGRITFRGSMLYVSQLTLAS